jgi:hypothetical protein
MTCETALKAPKATAATGFRTEAIPGTMCSAPACAPSAVVTSAADRAGWCAKTGKVAALDLIDGIKAGTVKLEDLKADQLPEEMRRLSLAERRAYLAKIESERSRLQTEAAELDRKRSEFISQELRRRNAGDGFDSQVMDMLREQAQKYHLAY